MPEALGPAAPKLAYAVDEAAELVSCSRAHLYNEIKAGRLPSVLIGHSRRILHTDLTAYLERGRV
jgi:excisionase family DNA binding protein